MHAYGYHESRMRVVPNAAEIQRMKVALDWLRFIDHPEPGRAAIDQRIVWMRVDGHRWRTICRAVGLGRSQAWRRWSAALMQLSRALGKAQRRRSQGAKPTAHAGDAGIGLTLSPLRRHSQDVPLLEEAGLARGLVTVRIPQGTWSASAAHR